MQFRLTLPIVLLLAPAFAGAQPKSLKPVPSAAEITAAKKLVAEVFQKDVAAAKTNDQKRNLAKQMLAEAVKNTTDPAAEFACLDAGRIMAANVGDVQLALAINARMSERFAVDSAADGLEIVRRATPNAKSPEDLLGAEFGLDGVYHALVKAKRWDHLVEVCRLGQAGANKGKDTDLAKNWGDRLTESTAREAKLPQLKEALATLEQSPTDPVANETAGKLLCFLYDDWNGGLTFLALAADKDLQKLAEADLKAVTPPDRLAVADAWFDLAAKEKDSEVMRKSIQRRALEHYRMIASGLTGLSKTRAEKRAGDLFAAAMPDRVPLSACKITVYRAHGDTGPFFTAIVNARQYPNSLWAHSPGANGAAEAIFELPCEFKYCKGFCGFHTDDIQPQTPVQFRATDNGDGWRMKDRLNKSSTLTPFRIDLKGQRKLHLVVDCPGSHHNSWATWISPMLQK